MKKLGRGAITTGSGTLIYTVPTGMKCDVKDIVIANTSAAPITCGLYLVPVTGTAGTTNAMFPAVSVPGNTTIHWCGTQTLNAGDFIQGIGSAAGITVNVTGEEYRVSV